MVDNLLKVGVGTIMSIWIARWLGPERFGIYSYAVIYASFFYVLIGLGIRKIVVRELSKPNANNNQLIGTSFFLMLSSAVLMTVLCPLSAFLFSSSSKFSILLISIMSSGFIFRAFETIAYYHESKTQMKWVVIFSTIAFFTGTLIKIVALLNNTWVYWFVTANMLELALGSLLLVFVFPKSIGRWKNLQFDFSTAKRLLKESMPLVVTAVAVKLYTDIDQVMIKNMYSISETGKYAIAAKFSKICSFLPSAVFVSVFPNLVKSRDYNHSLYKKKLQKLYNLCSFSGYGFVIFFMLFSDFIIQVLLGAEYKSSSFFLKILIWSTIFGSLGGARSLYLISENRTNLYMYSVLIGCVINIFLNYVFIPIYGGIAACWTTLITTFIAGIGFNFFIPELRETGFMQLKSLVYPKFWI